jgi:phosphohistidine phosphatase SixA
MTDNTEALVYLVRHGEAKPRDEDPERPLCMRDKQQLTAPGNNPLTYRPARPDGCWP